MKFSPKRWFFSSAVFGLGFVLVFSLAVAAWAVVSGPATNPTPKFGPSNADIDANLKVTCNWSGWYCATAPGICDGQNTGGGGDYYVLDSQCTGGAITAMKHRHYNLN